MMHIVWQSPENLWYIPLLIGILVCVWVRVFRVRAVADRLATPAHRATLLNFFSHKKNVCKALLLSLGSIALFLVLLRPSWQEKEETLLHEGRDLVIALDVSRSMLAADCHPDRLTVAKNKIKALVHTLGSDRVALILFAGSAFVQCPLTTDRAAFFMFLDAVDVQTISSGTTALDAALGVALDLFEQLPERKNKVMAIFTDGEDFSSGLSRMKTRAQQAGLHIFTVGVGTSQGAPIPLFDEQGKAAGHQRDKKGGIVMSRLNEGILRALAADSAAEYIALTSDNADISRIAERVQQYEKEKLGDRKYASIEEQYPFFVLVSFICFALEWIL